MTESSLAKAIDELAKQKAKAFNERVCKAIEHALKDLFHQYGAYVGDATKAVLTAYVKCLEKRDDTRTLYWHIPPHPVMIDAARIAVLKEILDKVPLIRELDDLAAVVAEQPAAEENQPTEY